MDLLMIVWDPFRAVFLSQFALVQNVACIKC